MAPCGAWEARLGVGIFSFLPLFFCLNGQPRERKKKKKIYGDQSAGLGPLDWASILGREIRALCPWAGLRGLGARGSDWRCCLQLNPGECARLVHHHRVPESRYPACVPVCCRLAIPVLWSPPNKLWSLQKRCPIAWGCRRERAQGKFQGLPGSMATPRGSGAQGFRCISAFWARPSSSGQDSFRSSDFLTALI